MLETARQVGEQTDTCQRVEWLSGGRVEDDQPGSGEDRCCCMTMAAGVAVSNEAFI